ncbi:hypothetical protein ACFC1R_15510 [Kitasatospora sp. NPDC056138]|uniref:hypothetical protein n=1 Tax=Kitasatospora sp. NPDC056138 TaxID=3345724 RepID=UPI0035E26165
MAALLAEFNAYLERDGADPTADSVGYRQGTLWLSSDELAEMIGELREVFKSRAANKHSPGRSPIWSARSSSRPSSHRSTTLIGRPTSARESTSATGSHDAPAVGR